MGKKKNSYLINKKPNCLFFHYESFIDFCLPKGETKWQ